MTKLILLFLFISCTHQKKVSDQELEVYCQDLNVLLTKISAITDNIVNINTTRTSEGGYYKRKIVKNCKNGLCEIERDSTPPIFKYEPKHPDANSKGYVAYPNYTPIEEQADQKKWESVYEVVYAAAPVKNAFFLQDARAKRCFDKYPEVNEKYNYRQYLGR